MLQAALMFRAVRCTIMGTGLAFRKTSKPRLHPNSTSVRRRGFGSHLIAASIRVRYIAFSSAFGSGSSGPVKV